VAGGGGVPGGGSFAIKDRYENNNGLTVLERRLPAS
jgi:hypothetical protein